MRLPQNISLNVTDAAGQTRKLKFFDRRYAGVAGRLDGSEDQTRSDVAIVHSPSGDYVLAIYTKEARDTGVKWDNEQRVVSEAWAREQPTN